MRVRPVEAVPECVQGKARGLEGGLAGQRFVLQLPDHQKASFGSDNRRYVNLTEWP